LVEDFPPIPASGNLAAVTKGPNAVTPIPSLLFRTYNVNSGGSNFPNHFRAGFFDNLPDEIPAPPASQDRFFIHSIGRHLRRDRFQSPFISFSPSLVWIVHKALESVGTGTGDNTLSAQQVNIAAVDGTMADTSRLWHAKPLLLEVRKLNNGTFWPDKYNKYCASTEWIAYGEVSGVLATTTLSHLQKLATEVDSVEKILRLDIIRSKPRMYMLRNEFFTTQVTLAHSTIIGLAYILLAFHITPDSSTQVIEAGVYTIVQGWALKVANDSILDEAFNQWLYYFFQQTKDNSASNSVKIDVARKAFKAGGLHAKEDLESEARRYCRVSARNNIASSSSVVIPSVEVTESHQDLFDEYDNLDDILYDLRSDSLKSTQHHHYGVQL
jgi:hypothetical protein